MNFDGMTIDEIRNAVRGAKIIEQNARDLETQISNFADKARELDPNDDMLRSAYTMLHSAVRYLADFRNRFELAAKNEAESRAKNKSKNVLT